MNSEERKQIAFLASLILHIVVMGRRITNQEINQLTDIVNELTAEPETEKFEKHTVYGKYQMMNGRN